MRILRRIIFVIAMIALQVKAMETHNLNFNITDAKLTKATTANREIEDTITQKTITSVMDEINSKMISQTTTTSKPFTTATTVNPTNAAITKGINYTLTNTVSTAASMFPSTTISSKTTPLSTPQPELTAITATPAETPTNISSSSNQYCVPSLCEFFNGTHTTVRPHIACKNSGNFSPACGSQPHLLKMSERRRNLILDLHNLARSRIALGQVEGYKPASHMPQLKWDNELEYLATLHVKRCEFEHDLCHNTPRYPYSGQNIGYFWKGANITSHSKRMKNFIVNWFKEYKDANQTFVDSFHLHPEEKMIGHFTAMIGDRVHHVGCAVIHYYESDLTKILMTCNYDYNNFVDEAVYKTGPTASKCAYKISEKFPGLCDWKVPIYEYNETDELFDEYENSSNLVLRV